MKTRILDPMTRPARWPSPLIARFGRARLVARADGRAELCGATPDEETQAKEWISLFHHETVLARRASDLTQTESGLVRNRSFRSRSQGF